MYNARRKRPSARFYLILGVTGLVVVGVVLFLLFGLTKTVTAQQGTMTYEQNFEGVIIRNETVLESDNFSRVTFEAREGQTVTEGTKIVDLYKMGYNYKNFNALTTLQKMIKEYQENSLMQDTINQGYNEINKNIDNKAKEVMQAVSGEGNGDVVELEREMKTLLQERMEFLKNSFNPDEILKKHYENEEALKDKIAEGMQEQTASTAGIVSFYFDDLERIMHVDNLQTLTIKNIDDAMKGVSNSTLTDARTLKPLYRIVTPDDWYVLLIAQKPVPELTEGLDVTLIFEDVVDKQYSATVIAGREDPKGYLYTLNSKDNIGELLCARKLSTTVKKSYSGIIVPSAAVKEQDGMKYVNLKTNDGTKIVPVNILIVQGENAVIAPVAADSGLTATSSIVY